MHDALSLRKERLEDRYKMKKPRGSSGEGLA